MEKVSVLKPFTVLVAVITVIVLGFVSLTRMQTDLLPAMSLPYMIIVTPYPGASPERVEKTVTQPMENALATISHVKNVFSTSSENFSMLQLEFEDGTDMDSSMVKVSGAVQQVKNSLPEGCGTSSILEISMDMVANMYTAVTREGYDRYQMSDFADQVLQPYLARQDGVASVSTIGLIEKQVQVELNQKKIDEVNERILEKTDEELEKAKKKLDDAREEVKKGQEELKRQQESFGSMLAGGIFGSIDTAQLSAQLQDGINDLISRIEELQNTDYEENPEMQFVREEAEKAAADFNQAYNDAEDLAQELSQEATEAGYNFTGIADNAVARAIGSLEDNDDEITNARLVTADTLNGILSSAQDTVQMLSDEEIADGVFQAVDTYSQLYEQIYGEVLPSEEASRISAEMTASLMDDRNEVQQLYEEAERAAEEAQALLNQALDAANIAEDLIHAGNSVSETLNSENAREALNGSIDDLYDTYELLEGGSSDALIDAMSHLTTIMGVIRGTIAQISLENAADQLETAVANVETALNSLNETAGSLPEMVKGLEGAAGQLFQGQLDAAVGFSEAQRQLNTAQQQLDAAEDSFRQAKEDAYEKADLGSLVSASTLSQLIYAQNFEMPAGYINDESGNSWLLKIGEEYERSEDIAETLLADLDGIGVIRLADVADITVIDNSGTSYTRVNGTDAVVLAVFKNSTAGTNEVSRNCVQAISELEEDYPGTRFVTLMDQGEYISEIVRDILISMALGALLAIIVLALFLRDVRPTIMVGISIPLSVLFTLVLMYFTNLSLNIMTLGGISLGIGMLVDNSIVVMENIIRLRQRGISPAGAAVQGTRQVSGAIIASTLTTVCVFLPMLFTTGTVKELLVPMALSITFCLVASLVAAMTVIPASASVILRTQKEKKAGLFDRVLNVYEKILSFFLDFKIVPIGISVGLFAVCVMALIRTGIVVFPEMTSDNIQITINTPETFTREESYAEVDRILEKAGQVEGVQDFGAIDAGGGISLISGIGGSEDTFGAYTAYITLEEGIAGDRVKELVREIEAKCADSAAEVNVSTGGMSDMSAMLGSGLSINVYGSDMEKLEEICSDVADQVALIDGFENISDGTEEYEEALQLKIDKDRLMAEGLTVAQVFAQISSRMQTEVDSTTFSEDGLILKVFVKDETDPLTRENLLNMEFEKNAGMSQAFSQGMGSGSADMMSQMGGTDLMAMAEAMGAQSAGETEGDTKVDSGDNETEEEEKEEDKPLLLSDFAEIQEIMSPGSVARENQKRYMTVSATVAEGKNLALLTRELQPELERMNRELPNGYSIETGGELTQISDMIEKMSQMLALAFVFIYFVMVAQFQSLLSPFIILFTVPLAFTGGMLGLLAAREQISIMSLMGFLVLMGTVVNNGIVFVDYVNQLRIGGLGRRQALIAAGRTRMRPILMTAMTTILAMTQLIFGKGMGSQIGRGMAIVIASGLMYATLMTLFVIPVMYDILFKRQPLHVLYDESVDDIPDDAAEFLEELERG